VLEFGARSDPQLSRADRIIAVAADGTWSTRNTRVADATNQSHSPQKSAMTPPAPAPDRYRHAVIAHIMLDDAAAAIDFYQQALSATELFRIASAEGGSCTPRSASAGAVVMVGDAEPPFAAPTASGSTTVGLHVYLDDVDTALTRAEQAGAIILQPAQDMFCGDRADMLLDP
jgi:PhnB protein